MQNTLKFFWVALICFFCPSCRSQSLLNNLSKDSVDLNLVPYTESACWKEMRELDGVPVIDVLDMLEGLSVMPSYIGGYENYLADVYDKVSSDSSNGTLGESVIVVMVIDTTGIVRKECIYNKTRTTHTGFELEILAAIRQLQWIPGEKNGKKVPVSTMMKFKSDDVR